MHAAEDGSDNSFLKRVMQTTNNYEFPLESIDMFPISWTRKPIIDIWTNESTMLNKVTPITSLTLTSSMSSMYLTPSKSSTSTISKISTTTKATVSETNHKLNLDWSLNSTKPFKMPHRISQSAEFHNHSRTGSLIDTIDKQQRKHLISYSPKTPLIQELQHKCFCEPDHYIR
jgi:hypothetical protein